MRRIRSSVEGRNRLLKVRVDYQQKDQWYMKPEYDKKGNRVSMGHYIFRGDDAAFRKHLVRCKVSDTEMDPPSYRSMRYIDIVKRIKEPKRTYVWMQSKNWNAMNGIQENTSMKRLSENIDTLHAVIYDLAILGEADPIFVRNLKNEYDGVIGKSIIKQAMNTIDVNVPYAKIAQTLISAGMIIT